MDYAQSADINTQLHGGGAEKRTDRLAANTVFIWHFLRIVLIPFRTEPQFPVFAVFGGNLPGVVFCAQTLGFRKITAIHFAEKHIGLRIETLVGATLDDIRLNGLAVAQAPYDLVDGKAVYDGILVFLVTGFLRAKVACAFKLGHQESDETRIFFPP